MAQIPNGLCERLKLPNDRISFQPEILRGLPVIPPEQLESFLNNLPGIPPGTLAHCLGALACSLNACVRHPEIENNAGMGHVIAKHINGPKGESTFCLSKIFNLFSPGTRNFIDGLRFDPTKDPTKLPWQQVVFFMFLKYCIGHPTCVKIEQNKLPEKHVLSQLFFYVSFPSSIGHASKCVKIIFNLIEESGTPDKLVFASAYPISKSKYRSEWSAAQLESEPPSRSLLDRWSGHTPATHGQSESPGRSPGHSPSRASRRTGACWVDGPVTLPRLMDRARALVIAPSRTSRAGACWADGPSHSYDSWTEREPRTEPWS